MVEPNKENLEAVKLREEIKQLQLPWYRKSAYLGRVLVPIVLATVALVGGTVTGYFDAERSLLQGEKERLTLEVQKLRDKAADIKIKLKVIITSLSDIVEGKEGELNDLIAQMEPYPENLANQAASIRAKLTDIH